MTFLSNSSNKISEELRKKISSFSPIDTFLLNNHVFSFDAKNFQTLQYPLSPSESIYSPSPKIAFIDGGQAELLIAANFCVSFIRVAALVMLGEKKIKQEKHEFFLLTTAISHNGEIWYENKIFSEEETKEETQGKNFLSENDLFVSSQDTALKTGNERAVITKVAGMARRFTELALATEISSQTDFILLDGTLEKTYPQEEKFLQQLPKNSGALAKSSSLFTSFGNNPSIFLHKKSPDGCWRYDVGGETLTSFVKLHEKAKHVFRFEGNTELLNFLLPQCTDATFLGYPYGLILADKLARVSNEEKKSLQMRFLLDKDNKEILEYLSSSNAHDILDQK